MTVYVVDLEAVSTRYTGEWKTYVPYLLEVAGLDVVVVEGPADIPPATSPGAFLNFGGTNIYKAAQVQKLAKLFCDNVIKDGDYFLFTDAWHPGIINLKYMAELLGIKVKIGACWHAGSYDPWDFLGRLIGDAPWVRHAELAFFNAIDHNYFATDFHIKLFADTFIKTAKPWEDEEWKQALIKNKKIVRTGWPMAYMPDTLAPYKGLKKRDLILFPHRIAPEKQVEMFRELATMLPQYEFVVCQDKQLTKHEYHTLLGESKMVFSCSLQETLGIGLYEGAILDSMPLCPDRLSYTEMYFPEFKYLPKTVASPADFARNKDFVAAMICMRMLSYDSYVKAGTIQKQAKALLKDFFSADIMVDTIKGKA